jgi:SAM-dependent methyltransferase
MPSRSSKTGRAGERSAAAKPLISILVPMYNEERVIDLFFARMDAVIGGLDARFEYICVNDGSRDRTLDLLLERARQDPRVVVVNFTRNFGKEAAMTAALDFANGDAVIPIDADLQDPPELVAQFIARWREGYEVVYGVRRERSSDTLGKRTTAGAFYRLFNRLSDIKIPPDVGDYRLMDRAVVENLKRLPERNRFMKGLFAWVGGGRQQVELLAAVEFRPRGHHQLLGGAAEDMELRGPRLRAAWGGLCGVPCPAGGGGRRGRAGLRFDHGRGPRPGRPAAALAGPDRRIHRAALHRDQAAARLPGVRGRRRPARPAAVRGDDGFMRPEAYADMHAVEGGHWWFVARRRILADVIRRFAPPRPLTLLEAGCGTGGNLRMLAGFGQVTAFEPNEAARATASRLGVAEVVPGVLPGPHPIRDRFDVVCAFDVIEHLDEDEASCRALAALMKPDGVGVFTVPAFAFLWSNHDVVLHHRRRYTRAGFVRMLQRAGLEVVYSSYFNFFLFPPIAAHRLLQKALGKAGGADDSAGVPPAPVNAALRALFGAERFLLPWLRLPFGVSIVTVVRPARG